MSPQTAKPPAPPARALAAAAASAARRSASRRSASARAAAMRSAFSVRPRRGLQRCAPLPGVRPRRALRGPQLGLRRASSARRSASACSAATRSASKRAILPPQPARLLPARRSASACSAATHRLPGVPLLLPPLLHSRFQPGVRLSACSAARVRFQPVRRCARLPGVARFFFAAACAAAAARRSASACSATRRSLSACSAAMRSASRRGASSSAAACAAASAISVRFWFCSAATLGVQARRFFRRSLRSFRNKRSASACSAATLGLRRAASAASSAASVVSTTNGEACLRRGIPQRGDARRQTGIHRHSIRCCLQCVGRRTDRLGHLPECRSNADAIGRCARGEQTASRRFPQAP